MLFVLYTCLLVRNCGGRGVGNQSVPGRHFFFFSFLLFADRYGRFVTSIQNTHVYALILFITRQRANAISLVIYTYVFEAAADGALEMKQ